MIISGHKNEIRRRTGAVSLLFCLITGGILSVFAISWQASVYYKNQLNLQRALSAAVNASLAAYDRDLHGNYGLWGVQTADFSPGVFTALVNNKQVRAEIDLAADQKTLSADCLNSQITAHMSLRAPAGWLEKLAADICGISAPAPDLSLPVKTSGQAADENLEDDSILFWDSMDDMMDSQYKLQEFIFNLIPLNLTLNTLRSCLEWAVSPLVEEIQETAGQMFQQKLDQIVEECLPVYTEDFGEQQQLYAVLQPDFYDPRLLAEMAGYVDRLLQPSDNAVWSKILAAEYCLSYFPAKVTQIETDDLSGKRPVLTPDGRLHSDLGNSRINEVERIITDLEDPERAADRIEGNIIMVRSVIRIIEVLADQEKLQTYRPVAQTLSSLVTAASAGSVIIDPEVIVWLMAVADGVSMGLNDTDLLLAGKSVPLWTYNGQDCIDLYYHDYLRLFLLIKPQDKLLASISRVICQALPGDYAYAISASTDWYGRKYSVCSGYDIFAEKQL